VVLYLKAFDDLIELLPTRLDLEYLTHLTVEEDSEDFDSFDSPSCGLLQLKSLRDLFRAPNIK